MRRPSKSELEVLDVVRCFQRYTPEQRANLASSHRTGYRQRKCAGEYYYTTSFSPGIAFPTQGRAVEAARAAIAKATGEIP